jgi:hypothetical protein
VTLGEKGSRGECKGRGGGGGRREEAGESSGVRDSSTRPMLAKIENPHFLRSLTRARVQTVAF